MSDIVIRKGTVIDGTGRDGMIADVVIDGDRITSLTAPGSADSAGAVVIEAEGKLVCPGIIDVHSHADVTIFRKDHKKILEPLVRQGITTFVGGNCGMSLAPLGDAHYDSSSLYIETFTSMDVGKTLNWRSMGEFLDVVEKNGLLLNMAPLAPHGLIRITEMGLEARYADNGEIAGMSATLEECMEAGCVGMSTGLQYFPGSQSETRELIQLAKVISKYNGIFTSHLRSYSNTLGLAVDEILEICRENNIPGQISHIFHVPDFGRAGRPIRAVVRAMAKLADYWNPPIPLDGHIMKHLTRLDKFREEGEVNVRMDVMPTTTGFTLLLAFFPPWVLTGNKEDIFARLKDPETRKRIYKEIVTGRLIWPHVEGNTWSLNLFKIMGWECVRIMSVVSEANKKYEGMHLPVIAKERGQHPFETVCDLLLEEDGKVLIFESMARPEDNFTERSMYAPLFHPEVMITTDTILMGFGKPSYLFYGCYPKFLSRYCRDMKKVSLESAVRKITGLPAEHFNIKKRGLVKDGFFADLLVLDLDRIDPCCTFTEPIGVPAGIEHVLINGHHVLDNGKFNAEPLPGRLLRRK